MTDKRTWTMIRTTRLGRTSNSGNVNKESIIYVLQQKYTTPLKIFTHPLLNSDGILLLHTKAFLRLFRGYKRYFSGKDDIYHSIKKVPVI